MTRKEAQNALLESLKNNGKDWDDVVLISPRKGKDSWTKREMYEAIIEDRDLDGCPDSNPIDSLLRFDKWKKNGRK
jgi:hypothetical protein